MQKKWLWPLAIHGIKFNVDKENADVSATDLATSPRAENACAAADSTILGDVVKDTTPTIGDRYVVNPCTGRLSSLSLLPNEMPPLTQTVHVHINVWKYKIYLVPNRQDLVYPVVHQVLEQVVSQYYLRDEALQRNNVRYVSAMDYGDGGDHGDFLHTFLSYIIE